MLQKPLCPLGHRSEKVSLFSLLKPFAYVCYVCHVHFQKGLEAAENKTHKPKRAVKNSA